MTYVLIMIFKITKLRWSTLYLLFFSFLISHFSTFISIFCCILMFRSFSDRNFENLKWVGGKFPLSSYCLDSTLYLITLIRNKRLIPPKIVFIYVVISKYHLKYFVVFKWVLVGSKMKEIYNLLNRLILQKVDVIWCSGNNIRPQRGFTVQLNDKLYEHIIVWIEELRLIFLKLESTKNIDCFLFLGCCLLVLFWFLFSFHPYLYQICQKEKKKTLR